jgi:Ca-activated chloride channel family protein
MTIEKSFLVFPLFVAVIGIIAFLYRNLQRRENVLKSAWMVKFNLKYKASELLKVTTLSLLLVTLLDFRSEPVSVESQAKVQKTVILIDNSASMLVEDVRPNRIEKALLLAKHYIKNAVGQQVAISLFSDTQKKFIPFTRDYDLVIARLSSIKEDLYRSGGTNLTVAINDVVSLFRAKNGYNKGNILIFTDAEETLGEVALDVPKEINVALVGVGTLKGGPIPLRDRRGNFIGYKKFNGSEVESKLDEDFIKKIGTSVSNFKYWIAGSYSLPTQQILDFFKTSQNNSKSKTTHQVQEVYTTKIVSAVLILFILSILMKIGKVIVPLGLVLFIPTLGLSSEKEIDELKRDIIMGKEVGTAKIQLYNKLIKAEKYEDSMILMNENKDMSQFKTPYATVNKATSLFLSKKISESLELFEKILSQSDSKVSEVARSNLLLLMNQKNSQDKSEGKEEQEEQNKKDDKQNQSGQSQENQEKEEQGDNKSNKNDKSPGQENQDQKKSNDGEKDDNDKDEQGTESQQNKQEQENGKDKENMKSKSQEKRGNKKLPVVIKQIIDSDNELQKKLFDTSTKQDSGGRRKDW